MGNLPLSNSIFQYATASVSTPLLANNGQPDGFPLATADGYPFTVHCPVSGHIRYYF